MFFGHWAEILGLLVVALLVFGPKRMIEMGSALGRAFRELREATKDVNWSNLMSGGDAEPETYSTYSTPSQSSQPSDEPAPTTTATPVTTVTPSPIVEATVEPIDEATRN